MKKTIKRPRNTKTVLIFFATVLLCLMCGFWLFESWGLLRKGEILSIMGTITCFCILVAGFLVNKIYELKRSLQLSEKKRFVLENSFEERFQEKMEHVILENKEAVKSLEARDEFLAHMNHEIRTPLNGIVGVLTLIKDVPMGKEYTSLLEATSRSADSLLLILNDVLDFSKIEAGKIDFEAISFNLCDVVEETVTLFVDMASSKGVELLCDVSRVMYKEVIGDPTRLRQIITNLVGNSIKFTNKGEVLLCASLEVKDGCRPLCRLEVRDTGIGISEEAQKTIFDKFSQAEDSTNRKYGGSGLGLNVCKQLVELQDGEIGLASKVGKGTLFWLNLPMVIAEDTSHPIDKKSLQGKTVLVVDDNATLRNILQRYLVSWGVQVFTSDSAKGAMVLLRNLGSKDIHVDLFLIDIELPDKNGWELANELDIIFRQKCPPIYLLSSERGNSDHNDISEGVTVLSKPVRQFQLYNILQSTHFGKDVEEKNWPQEKNLMQGKVLLVDDEPVNQRVGAMLLEKMGLHVELAGDGEEAIKKVKTTTYDLILMDLSMPNIDGLEATSILRAMEKNGEITRVAIIAFTANALQSVKDDCLKIGMDDFISKPVKPGVLAKKIEPWVSLNYSLIEAQKGGEEILAHISPDENIWDVQEALNFVNGDQELLYELIDLFIKRKGKLLAAIDLALVERDAQALNIAAHAFKGAVNHFSALKVRDLAQGVEDEAKKGDLHKAQMLVVELKTFLLPLEHSLKEALKVSKV